MKISLRQLFSGILLIGLQLSAKNTIPPQHFSLKLIDIERAAKKPLGFYLDSSKINLVTKGQFRLFHNNPFHIYGDTFGKSIPVQDRFGNSCPKYYIRKTVFDKNNPRVNTITIFKERAFMGGFTEFVIRLPAFDSLRPILVIEKPRFASKGKVFKAKWVSERELLEMVWKNGIDTRHYYRIQHKKKNKILGIS
jgi:hypothetical protein